jgi:hypothetical protein
MKTLKLILVIIIGHSLLVSCASFGFRYDISEYFNAKHGGYKLLSDSEKNNIVFFIPQDSLPDVFDSTKFYAITARHLKDYLSKYDSCLIYLWNDHCGASLCLSPLVYQQYSEIHGYKFVFIPRAYYYVRFVQNFNTDVDYPYFCINSFYYKNTKENKYLFSFMKDLIGKKVFNQLKYNDQWNRWWIYKDGKFYPASRQLIRDIEELQFIDSDTRKIKTNKTITKEWRWERKTIIE